MEAIIDDIELSALLCSKVCHDVISPVGAINNGLEVLDEDDSDDMKDIAIDLIRKSARQASNKLQFCRIAFGALGSAGAEVDLADCQQVINGFLVEEKATLTWNAPAETRPKNEVKLLLNLFLISLSSIPRGGNITINVTDEINIIANGPKARIPDNIKDIFSESNVTDGITQHNSQLYYTARLATIVDFKVSTSINEENFVINARK